MKKVQRGSFKLNPIAASIVIAMASQFSANVALAGSGFGSGFNISNQPAAVQTYYANSPAGAVPSIDAKGVPLMDASKQAVLVNSGTAMRKFVDALPGFGPANANTLGQYIPVAVPEKWTDSQGNATTDEYYEIAAVEYSEKMHSDLPKATHLRGYVQLMTPGLAAKGVVAKSFTTADGRVLSVVDNPHHLGPVIQAAQNTAVRVKFTNYLPVGGNLFLPVDKTITGAGLGPDGKTYYTENRAEIHLVGGEAPWISAGSPHQWVAPAGETAAYLANMGKGVSAQNVPDMVDPGAGSTTLYFPNAKSARFTFYHDRTSGLTRLNTYAGLEAGYVITDPIEQKLITDGVIPADQIPLIIEDKTFVPANVSQQDAKWDTAKWGQPGDLWFPHVYETNQNPNSFDGTNPVGRWDFGPWFWPIFASTADLPSGEYGNASFVPEAYQDTPVINGTAYPSLTVDPKAYRFRILNASNDRYVNLGLYKADGTVKAPQLDQNGNQIVDATGNPLYFSNTEVKMVPAVGDVNGAPLVPSYTDQTCLCQYPALTQLQSSAFRAWPIDGRFGGAPDPTSVGPDFIAIGNDGGLLPNAVDIPSQPVTYESNRRSVTVGNVYGYGLLVGPSERSDVIVDFSAYAGQTLILYNDAPTPFPFNDNRVDYFTGTDVAPLPDQTASGGAYATLPGYGPNTRTMMQIKVNAAPTGTTPAAYDPTALLTKLPAAYAASQSAPIVPQAAYNAAFKTNDADNYAHVATGSIAQPNLDFVASGTFTITGINLIASGGTLVTGTTNIVQNVTQGSGTGYDAAKPPKVVFNNIVNGVDCSNRNPSAAATAVVDASTKQVTSVILSSPYVAAHTVRVGFRTTNVPASGGYAGYICAPLITFENDPLASSVGIGAQATVQTTNSQSIPVLTKAEQELFDAAGRYNSTGGVELPLTNGLTQTTVPLNFTDSPTEFIADGETQIWKLVDNGFWSNSIHFDMVDVQLINRVGWDGTVKVPGATEVGWKDTLRLNPLEDVVVAMRAKRAAVPFGLPASQRAQDPSLPIGATNRATQLPFLVDPAVTAPDGVTQLLTTSTNISANYDNEFTWGTAILGHAEDDFTRPIVFQPTVTRPDAPSGVAINGTTLTWADPTPAATSKSNVKNEIGFKILRADGGNLTAFKQIGSALANATSFTDTAPPTGMDYAYEVQAWNGANSTSTSGTSAAVAVLVPPAAPAGLAYIAGKVTWTAVPGATGYLVSVNGGAAKSTTTTSMTPTGVVNGGISYDVTVVAQKILAGSTANSTASSLTFMSAPAVTAPSTVKATIASPTSVDLSWIASTATGANVAGVTYTILRKTTGAYTTLGTSTTTSYTDTTAIAGATYTYQIVAAAANVSGATTATATLSGVTVAAPTAPTMGTASAPIGTTKTVKISWTDRSTNETSFQVDRQNCLGALCASGGGNWSTVWTSAPALMNATSMTQNALTTGTYYRFRVQAINGAGSSAWSATSNAVQAK
jgi:fibronectin type 3 domain-containing protein